MASAKPVKPRKPRKRVQASLGVLALFMAFTPFLAET